MSDQIAIQRIEASKILIPIRGTAPLLVHRFSQKAKQQMLDAQQGKRSPKQSRDPESEYDASIYHLKGNDDQDGFPAVAFKSATVSAARFFGKDVSMTGLRQSLFLHGEPGEDGQALIPIVGTPEMREDVVRIGRGSSDLRYRAQYTEWSAVLPVTFVKALLTMDSVLSLVDAGGLGVGVGEWRPEKSGDFGTYEIDLSSDVEVVQ